MARPATAAVRLLTGEREPVHLATTANILLQGLQTIDGVLAAVGDRVLVKDQTDPTQNGIYTVSEGEWFRAADARTARTLQKGTTVHTQVGTANADRVFQFTADEPIVGTDAIAIVPFVPPDVSDVVDEVEALRDETQVLKDATEASAGQASASASASAANAGQTAADVVATTANLASAQAARDASLYGKGIFPTIAVAIGLGVVGSGAITAGSGGTNGTFDLAFTGGAGSGAAGRFVVAGGALTQILITAPGSYTAAPSFSFAASAGLAGAAATVVLGRNVGVGEYLWTEVSAGVLGLYSVTAGPVATDTSIRAATSVLVSNVDALAQIGGLGTPTAKLTEAAGSVIPLCYRTFAFANATTYEIVVIAKAAERGALQIFSNGAGSGWVINFDLFDGTFAGSGANFVSATMTALGAGWYECKAVVLTTAAISSQLQTRLSAGGVFPYAGDGTSGTYVRSIVLRLPNTTTNLLPSSDPNNAAFAKTGCTAPLATTPEARVLPPLQTLVDSLDILVNGRLVADKIIEPVGSGSPSVYHVVSIVSGDTFVFDVVAKAGERTRLNLFGQTPAAFDCTFDLVNGTAVGFGAAFGAVSIIPLGNGWYRCRVTGTATGAGVSTNFQHRIYPAAGGHSYVGDGISGLYLQQSSISRNGGPNVLAFSTDYASDYWSKTAGTTVSVNSGLYLGLLSDPAGIAGDPYDDGSAVLVGKKWAALGSSITIGAYYAPLLAGQTGMILTNLGVSGSALGLSTTAYPSYGMSNRIVDIPVDTELVTLEPGPNAFGAQETPLGVFSDTTYATHYGSLWAACVAIRAQAPNAKIVMIGTYSGGPGHATHRVGRVNGQGNTMDHFFEAERYVAHALGIPFIDISQSGMGYLTSTLYMADELHPNSAGSLCHATYAAECLRQMARRGLFGA